jgi:hypothetical protein
MDPRKDRMLLHPLFAPSAWTAARIPFTRVACFGMKSFGCIARIMSFLSSPLLYCGRQLGLCGDLGRDRKIWRRNETLCIDVTEYAELKSALGILKSCFVLQLSTLKHVNSQCKIIFKIQCNCSGRDSAAMCSEILLVTHVILKLVIFSIQYTVFGCSAMSATVSKQFRRILK